MNRVGLVRRLWANRNWSRLPSVGPTRSDSTLAAARLGVGLVKILFGTAVSIGGLCGGAVGYLGYYDPEQRKQLIKDYPYLKTPLVYIGELVGDKGSPLPPPLPAFTQSSEATKETPPTNPPVPDPVAVKTSVETEEQSAPSETVSGMLHDLQESMGVSLDRAELALIQGLASLREHTDALKIALDDGIERDDKWDDLSRCLRHKNEAVWAVGTAVDKSRAQISKVKSAIENARSSKDAKKFKSEINIAEKLVLEATYKVDGLAQTLEEEVSNSAFLERFGHMLKHSKAELDEDLLTLVTSDKKLPDSTSWRVSKQDLNNCLHEAYVRMEQLEQQLVQQRLKQKHETEQLMRDRDMKMEQLLHARLSLEKSRLQRDHLQQVQEMLESQKEEFEGESQRLLARQTVAFADHLKQVLKDQEEELKQRFNSQLAKEKDQIQKKYHESLASALSRLKGIEDAIDARADVEKMAFRSHELWLACESLRGLVVSSPEAAEATPRPLGHHLSEVVKLANSEFVSTVASTIPEVAAERGIFTEEDLKQRFKAVKRSCKRLAYVRDRASSHLGTYMLSFAQSLLVWDRREPAPEEIEGPLNTFDILSYATYSVETGDLRKALKLALLLDGEPAHTAADWVSEVTLYLECKQAAEILSAYAAASGFSVLTGIKR